MSDFFPSDTPASSNLQEVSVSELAGSIKRTIENTFDRVRVRGELGRVTIAKSGHMYADMKDDKAVINTIMWKGSVSRLPFRPEEGLEVIAEGKLSTYPGRSNYQLIAETMSPAGAGALMALLEERKKKLAAEGLFEAGRKKPLPYLPRVVGVVTSPTGAVIRDILHRISERFPVQVIVWPALVQGERAAAQIEAGIRGFNALVPGGAVSRPDLIIVARGGGSIEDLWPFNEEIVVRAAADSEIPLISAVGHETDTTLIDFVSDRRAPTPTGAAEIAVPVRADLIEHINGLDQRLIRGLSQTIRQHEKELTSLAARLPRPAALVDARQQRFDYAEGRLTSALQTSVLKKQGQFDQVGPRLRPQALQASLTHLNSALERSSKGLMHGLKRTADRNASLISGVSKRFDARGEVLAKRVADTGPVVRAVDRIDVAFKAQLARRDDRLSRASAFLEALSYQATLKRGFAVVKTREGKLVRDKRSCADTGDLTIQFADGELDVSVQGVDTQPRRKTPASRPGGSTQGNLF